jgi:glycosyltransferase involved in cell wall biosynthesis
MVAVANPGGVSWMLRAAEYFGGRSELAGYCSPVTVPESQLETIGRRLPRRLAGPVTAQLALRAAPAAVPPDRVFRTPTAPEVLGVLALRLGVPHSILGHADQARSYVFDRAVGRRLHSGVGAVIGYSGTTGSTFAAAKRVGTARILDYPLPHHDHILALCREEVALVPAYAATMQGHDIPSWRLRSWDREIAAADRIIMLCSYQQRSFEDAGIEPERLFMAPFGVDLDLFSPGPREDDVFRVLFCGQITQRKGISYLVDGFRKAELGNAELVFAGRPVGTTHPWIDEPRVRHAGALARPKLRDVYRSADVIVLPSLIEGFGATPLEGMACGLPAIVSDNSFAHDVIEDGVDGWVIPIRDSDSIASYLRMLYDDRDLQRRMGAAARKKAEQFTWERYGNALRAGIVPALAAG